MTYRNPEPEDPLMGIGVSVPGEEESTVDLAHALAEEFAAMGRDEAWIVKMFQTPFYAGAHDAYLKLGEARIREIVCASVAIWGRVRFVDHTPARMPGDPRRA